jgi:hypothetical protein
MQDMVFLKPHIDCLNNGKQIEMDIKEAITMNASKKIAFTVKVKSIPVGIVLISKNVNLDYYISHFCV